MGLSWIVVIWGLSCRCSQRAPKVGGGQFPQGQLFECSSELDVRPHIWCFSWDGWNSWGLSEHFSLSAWPPTWLAWASLQHGSPSIVGLFNLVIGFLQSICSMISRWNPQGFLWDSLGHQATSPLLHSVGHRWATGPAQVQGKRTTQGVNTRSAAHCGPFLETSYHSADKRLGPLTPDTSSLGMWVSGHF